MSAQPNRRYTLEEYLELDKNSDERLEYWDGEIFPMAGVSEEHDQSEYNDLNEIVKLASMDCEFLLSEVYQNISFKPRPGPLNE